MLIKQEWNPSLWRSILLMIALGIGLVAGSLTDLDAPLSSAQANSYAPQCPGLWDAAGRQFAVPTAPGGPFVSVGMEVAEFFGDAPSPEALICISNKLTVLHGRWGLTQHTSDQITLPHFQSLSYGHPDQIKHNLWITIDSIGVTNVSLLFGRNNHLVTLLFQADLAWTNQYLDSTAYGVWTALGSLPANEPTASDQTLNTGLWRTLALPAAINVGRFNDYIPVMFTGVESDSRYTTPALLAQVSRVGADLNGPVTTSNGTVRTAIPTSPSSQYATLPPTQRQPTCVPNQSTTGCDLTPLGVLQGRQTETVTAHETEQSRP